MSNPDIKSSESNGPEVSHRLRILRRVAGPLAGVAFMGGMVALFVNAAKEGVKASKQESVLTSQIDLAATRDGFTLEDLPDERSAYLMDCSQYACFPIDPQTELSTLKLSLDLEDCALPVEATAKVNAEDKITDVKNYKIQSGAVEFKFENIQDLTQLFGEDPCERVQVIEPEYAN